MIPNKTFIIRNKNTHVQWTTTKKSTWKQASHAKSAWAVKNYPNYFNDQDILEIVEVFSEDSILLKLTTDMLIKCLGSAQPDDPIHGEVTDFLEKHKL